MSKVIEFPVLSIDAWRHDGQWAWNNWHTVGKVAVDIDASNRKILAAMREAGYLSAASAGRVAIEDDGHNVVILAKGTREPIFAIEYGAMDRANDTNPGGPARQELGAQP